MRKNAAIDRNELFGESFAHDIQDISNPEATLLNRWIIEGPWKLLLTYDGDSGKDGEKKDSRTDRRPQLYHLLDDPFETNNVAKSKPELVQKLAKRIAGWYPLKERKASTEFKQKMKL